MRSFAWALLLCTALAITASKPQGRVIEVSTVEELIAAFSGPLDNVTVKLAPGTYELTPMSDFDTATFNCDENVALVPVTIGLTMSGRGVTLRGPDNGEAVIVTNASHGIYLKDCLDCVIERLTITRSVVDLVTDRAQGGIVVRNSVGRVANCVVRDNTGSREAVSGAPYPSGICLRAGARMTIEFNELAGNSVGVSLHKGSQAIIRHNLVEQLDSLGSNAIRIGCDAIATIERNHIRSSSMGGIVMADRSRSVCKANIVEECDMVGIGVESNRGAHAVVEKNVVYRCGAGVRLWGKGVTGRLSNNMIVESGNDGAISVDHRAEFTMRGNTAYGTEAVADREDVPREIFWRARRPWTRTYRNTPVGVDGRHKFHESAFLTRYGRWLH